MGGIEWLLRCGFAFLISMQIGMRHKILGGWDTKKDNMDLFMMRCLHPKIYAHCSGQSI